MENEEQSPRFGKKARTYLACTFGLICLMFVILILVEKLSDKQVIEDKKEDIASVEDDTSNNVPSNIKSDTFKLVGDERKLAKDTSDLTEHPSSNNSPLKTLTESLQPDMLTNEQQNIVALEYKRSALAARSTWGLEKKTSDVSHQIEPNQNIPVSTKLTHQSSSNDEQRKLIAKRLKEVAILKEQLKSGNYSAFEGQEKSQQLALLESSFSLPPPEIVGFTEENQYNASTEGLFKLSIGSIIPAITMTKANSDMTGTFKGLVSQDIFDVSGEYVLIPKGSEVMLKSVRVNNPNEVINPRVGTIVPWIILPNGNKIDLSTATGLDREGMAGLSDQVDRHLFEQFLGVAAYALIANESSYEGSGANTDSTYVGDVSQGLREQASPLAQKYLGLTPTNIIRTGHSMNVILEEELFLKPWRHIYEDYL